MTVTVTPAEFTLVSYEADRIAALVADVADRIGLPADLAIRVDVDERTPLARTQLIATGPVVLAIEGGAIEAPRNPRHLSENAVTVTAARLLGRLRDRRDPAFGTPPPEESLTLAQADAWDAYTLGRATRLGYETHQPRWRYRFRARHGFSDAVDRVFDRIWAAEALTWADLESACRETQAARGETTGRAS